MTDGTRRIDLTRGEFGLAVRGEARGRAALVFAHGYAMRSTGALYDDLLGTLAGRFAVHAIDLRGHGDSRALSAGWSFESNGDDVVEACAKLGLDRPIFVGHSFGGVVGLIGETRHPGTFGALALLSPGPADTRGDPVDTLDLLIERGRDREALRDGFAEMFVRPRADALERALDAAVLVDPEVHRAQKEQAPRFTVAADLGGVTPPCLVVSGMLDGVVDPARQREIAAKVRNGRTTLLSGEGHMMAIENPRLAAGEILSFANQIDAGTWPSNGSRPRSEPARPAAHAKP